MFSKPKKQVVINDEASSPALAFSEQQLRSLLSAIAAHLTMRATKSGIPAGSNPKMMNLAELSRKLDVMNISGGMNDSERLKAVMKEFAEAYLGICVDETKEGVFGGKKKGKTLLFMEDLLERYVVKPLGEAGKINLKRQRPLEKNILEAFSIFPEINDSTVDYLFKRAMTDGFGGNEERIFDNAATLVSKMGDAAIARWNTNLKTYLQGIPAEIRKKLEISPNYDEQNFTKIFKDVNKDKKQREEINTTYALELIAKMLTVDVYKLKAGILKADSDEGARYLIGGSLQFENLQKALAEIQTKKDGMDVGREMYKAVMKTYLFLYLYDRERGTWGTEKGHLLLAMEEILKNFQKKTASGLFVGAKLERPDALIISSIDSQTVAAEDREELVAYVLKLALKGGFEPLVNASEEREEKKRMVYVNARKAVYRMGDEAIICWNKLVADLNKDKDPAYEALLPFPDLVINSQNYSEDEANRTYDVLSRDRDFNDFTSQGVIQSLQDPRVKLMMDLGDSIVKKSDKGDKEEQEVEVPSLVSLQQKPSVDASHSEDAVVSSGVPSVGDEEDNNENEALIIPGKPARHSENEPELPNVLREFYDKQSGFHGRMKELNKAVEPLMDFLQKESVEDAKWMKFYLAPYKTLATNPFNDPGADAPLDEQLAQIERAVRKMNEPEEDVEEEVDEEEAAPLDNNLEQKENDDGIAAEEVPAQPLQYVMTDQMRNNLSAMRQSTFNIRYFLKYLEELSKSKTFAENAELLMIIQNLKGVTAIIPTQYSMRYQLLLAEIVRKLAPEAVADKVTMEQLTALVVPKVLEVNEEIRKFENLGKCFLIVTDVVPEKGKLKGFMKEMKLGGGINSAFVRVMDQEKPQFYFINLEENECLLLGVSDSKAAKLDKLTKEADKAQAQHPVVVELSEGQLQSFMKLTGYKYQDPGDRHAKEIERRRDSFRMASLSLVEYFLLMHTIREYILASKASPSTERLKEALASLKQLKDPSLSDEVRMAKAREAIMLPYIDIHLSERSKILGKTSKGANLRFLEGLLKKFDLLQLGEVEGKDRVDARIFSAFYSSPEMAVIAAKHLFIRALSEGLGGSANKWIYINARKAINRMGANAIGVWNEMAKAAFGAGAVPAALLMDPKKLESEERDIVLSYYQLCTDPTVASVINANYALEILINLFSKHLPNDTLLDKLSELIKRRDEHHEDVDSMVHQIVMEAYVKAQLSANSETKVGLFGQPKKGLDMKKLIKVICEFQKQTGSQLFGAFEKAATELEIHEAILHSVSAYADESSEFAKQFFEHTMSSGFGLVDPKAEADDLDAKKQSVYLRDLMAVIAMGEPAIKAWNQQAVKGGDPKVWADLIIQATNRDEVRLGRAYAFLAKNESFNTQLVQGVAQPGVKLEVSEMEPSQNVRSENSQQPYK